MVIPNLRNCLGEN